MRASSVLLAWLAASGGGVVADAQSVGAGSMVHVPAGSFMMGSKVQSDERPPHLVAVDAFEIDATEVTVDAYQCCVEAGKCTRPIPWKTCNFGQPGRENHPINCVAWAHADTFCRWAGKRLPTEEEWEYAATGTDGRTYPWGEAAPDKQLCWGRSITEDGTCAVGSHPTGESPFGLHDMAGNVWEWTASGFSKSYARKRTGALRVIRGGSWSDVEPSDFRAATRGRWKPTGRVDVIGFRCAR